MADEWRSLFISSFPFQYVNQDTKHPRSVCSVAIGVHVCVALHELREEARLGFIFERSVTAVEATWTYRPSIFTCREKS